MPRFSKYDGAGNDFVIVRAEEVGLGDPARLARRICARSTGAGVDGLVLVRSLSPELVRVRFFNPDGSEFSTCGNGSRCAALYAVERGLVEVRRLGLVTDAGEVGAEVRDGVVTLDYAIDARLERELEVRIGQETRSAQLVQVGTPHLVVIMAELPKEGFEELCRPLRHHPSLGPEGANVDLVVPEGPDRARIRTFERGVEGETRACGSGAMAAALALQSRGLAGAAVSFETRDRHLLRVELPAAENARDSTPDAPDAPPRGSGARTIRLTGPATFVFDGVLPDHSPA